MSKRDVLTIITKEGCKACAEIKPRIPALKQRIQANCPDLDIVEINWTKEQGNYPIDLDRFVNGFPAICRFTNPSWEAAKLNKTLKLEGFTYNAKWITHNGKERAILDNPRPPTDETSIINWIKGYDKKPVGTVEARGSYEPNYCARPLSAGKNFKFLT